MTEHPKEDSDTGMKVYLGEWISSMSNFETSNDLSTYHIKNQILYTFYAYKNFVPLAL